MWVAAPVLIREGATTAVMNLILITFIVEYLPKIYHAVCSLRRMQISGTIWWGIALNLMAYFVAAHVSIQNLYFFNLFFFFANFSIKLFYKPRRLEHLGTNQFCNMSYQRNACHSDIFLKFSHELIFQNAMLIIGQAVGACWFLLGVQRATKCLKLQCYQSQTCGPKTLACVNPIYYGTSPVKLGGGRLDWAHNIQARNTCLSSSDHFQYGAYKWTVNLVTNPNREEKILLPIFWGLMTLR